MDSRCIFKLQASYLTIARIMKSMKAMKTVMKVATAPVGWHKIEGWAWDGPFVQTVQFWKVQDKPKRQSGTRPTKAKQGKQAKKAVNKAAKPAMKTTKGAKAMKVKK